VSRLQHLLGTGWYPEAGDQRYYDSYSHAIIHDDDGSLLARRRSPLRALAFAHMAGLAV
jgi:hypothetical protein